MGFSYLQDKSWLEITREERLYCAFLYWDAKDREKDFISWLDDNHDLQLDSDAGWEIGYEVCFYRDLLKSRGESVNPTQYSSKRTFDLCLFSEETMVIIEAKVQQMFKESQIRAFQKDRDDIPKIVGKEIDTKIIALASSHYYENYDKFGQKDILKKFDACISWADIYDSYNPRYIYKQADDIYGK
ncbi:hypothetical protein ES708_23259 [subsurface metagenome]